MLAPWIQFFSTAAECAATLAGLVIVAISVNLARILQHEHLPARAWAAVSTLLISLILSLAALMPQPPVAFGVELAFAAIYGWVLHILTAQQMIAAHRRLGRPRHERWFGFLLGQSQVTPLTVGAGLVILGHPSGLYWVAFSLFASISRG